MRRRKREIAIEVETHPKPFQQHRTREETVLAAYEMRTAISTTINEMFGRLPEVWTKPEGALGRLEAQDRGE